jgi:hypothetical protein
MPAKKTRERATRSNANQAEAEISTNQLFRCLLSVVARGTIPEAKVREAVGKQIKAYNLLDGTRTLAEVGKAAHKDQGQMSRTVARWVEAGVVFRLGNGKGARLLHVYPIAEREAGDHQ